MNNFAFDYGLASKIAIHLANAGFTIYDSFKVANYEAGGIPLDQDTVSSLSKTVSRQTKVSPNEVRMAIDNAKYEMPSPELLQQARLALTEDRGFAIPTWAIGAGIGLLTVILLRR